MINKISQFLIAIGIVFLGLIFIFDWFILPIYVRQDKTIIVMDVTGKALKRAITELDVEGFKGVVYDTVYTSSFDPQTVIDHTVYTEYNPDYPKGTVAWQFPKYGDYIKKGLGLQITVSQGLPPDFFQVPQLFGLSMKKAKEALIGARLKVGKVSYQQNEDLVPYTVLDQNIAPGTVLDQTTQVDLIVSILDLQDIFDQLSNEK